MANNPHNLQVGQELCCVFNRNRVEIQSASIIKIGRKWAELSNNYRVDMKTLWMDGGEYSSPGRCYLDKQEYLNQREHEAITNSIRNKWKYECSLADLRTAAELLGVITPTTDEGK